MLLIALMLTGCGQIKNFIHSEINADLAEIKAELAALKAKNTEGWWNWRLSEDGWMSWISTPTIAITTAVFIACILCVMFTVYIISLLTMLIITIIQAWTLLKRCKKKLTR